MYMNYVVLNLTIRKQLYNKKTVMFGTIRGSSVVQRLEYSKDLTYGQVCIYVLHHNRNNNVMIKKIKT